MDVLMLAFAAFYEAGLVDLDVVCSYGDCNERSQSW